MQANLSSPQGNSCGRLTDSPPRLPRRKWTREVKMVKRVGAYIYIYIYIYMCLFVVVLCHSNSISVILWQWYDTWVENVKVWAYTFIESVTLLSPPIIISPLVTSSALNSNLSTVSHNLAQISPLQAFWHHNQLWVQIKSLVPGHELAMSGTLPVFATTYPTTE